MYITRALEATIEANLFAGKVIVIYGPRQSGKTTLVKKILESREKTKYLLCELPEENQVLVTKSPDKIIPYFEGANLVVLDEAQTVQNIGDILKVLVDTQPHIQIIATGSSSFELSNKVVEPLTGRNLSTNFCHFLSKNYYKLEEDCV